MTGGICWYCHWGWAKPVAEIYIEAIKRLEGYDRPLLYGPSHIVWEDENWDDDSLQYCLDNIEKEKDNFFQEELDVVRWSLEELLKIPQEQREVCPDDYDDCHPANYPPVQEVMSPAEMYQRCEEVSK